MSSTIERLQKQQQKRGKGLDDFKKKGQNDFRLAEQFQPIDLSDGKWHRVRLLPGAVAYGSHWIMALRKEAEGKVGKKGKLTFDKKKDFYKKRLVAHNIDIYSGQIDEALGLDPIYEAQKKYECFSNSYGKEGTGFGVRILMNLIDRDAQDDEPKKPGKPNKTEKETGFKEKDSDAWTPVRTLDLPRGAVDGKLSGLKGLNVQKDENGDKREFELSDLEHGMDINIRFDDSASSAGDKWQFQVADGKKAKNALTEDERKYLIYDLEGAIRKDREAQPLDYIERFVKQQLEKKGIKMAKDKKDKKSDKVEAKSKKDKKGKSTEEVEDVKAKKDKKSEKGKADKPEKKGKDKKPEKVEEKPSKKDKKVEAEKPSKKDKKSEKPAKEEKPSKKDKKAEKGKDKKVEKPVKEEKKGKKGKKKDDLPF